MSSRCDFFPPKVPHRWRDTFILNCKSTTVKQWKSRRPFKDNSWPATIMLHMLNSFHCQLFQAFWTGSWVYLHCKECLPPDKMSSNICWNSTQDKTSTECHPSDFISSNDWMCIHSHFTYSIYCLHDFHKPQECLLQW